MLRLDTINIPFYRLATNRVPFVSEFTEHVIQFLVVILERGLVLQGSACAAGGVVHRMLGTQGLLELLEEPTNSEPGLTFSLKATHTLKPAV